MVPASRIRVQIAVRCRDAVLLGIRREIKPSEASLPGVLNHVIVNAMRLTVSLR